jgi:protein brassinosteroid insensitive 1
VDLSSNQLTGCIPGLTTGIGNYSGFFGTLLNVSHNHIGGYFNISKQYSFNLLSTLDLSYNNISGDISTLIFCVQDYYTTINYTTYGPLCNLETLLINNNHFSGKFPIISTYFTPRLFATITKLDLSNNQFSGIIPPSIWNISTNLTVLNLSGNNFFGNLPNVTNLPSLLETLSMSKNQLNGELPDLSSFPQLKTLDLSDNQFDGSISPSIWSIIPKLNVLNLSNNKLHGKLPTMKDLQHCPNSLKSL